MIVPPIDPARAERERIRLEKAQMILDTSAEQDREEGALLAFQLGRKPVTSSKDGE